VGDCQFQYAVASDDPIGSILYWYSWKAWEAGVVNAFRTWLPGARRILDVGANTGFYTLLGAANGSEVTAFEPNPATFSRLNRNVVLNHFEQRCRLFQVAAGSKNGRIAFYLHDDPTCCSAVRIAPKQIMVPADRIDALVPLDERTDLVKMDVEGYEDHGLLGMERVIQDSHPKIIFECFRTCTAQVVEALLKGHGYRLMWIAADGLLVPIDRIAVDRYRHGQHNFAACV
jgi:FkbM family methyltransferase